MKRILVLLAAATVALAVAAPPARAGDAELVRTSRRALASLMATNPAARDRRKGAKAGLGVPK